MPFTKDTDSTLETSLGAWFNFESIIGGGFGYFLDETNNGRNLTAQTTIDVVTGKNNNGADFEAGDSDYTLTGDDFYNFGDTDFSISFWLKLESTGVSQGILQYKAENGAASSKTYEIRINTSNVVIFNCFNSSDTNIGQTSDGSLSAGTWYHVVVWHDSVNNEVGIKIDDGTAQTAATTGTIRDDNSHKFFVGLRDASPTQYFDGVLDNLGFWNKVLTGTNLTNHPGNEVSDLYNSGNGNDYYAIIAPTNLTAKVISRSSVRLVWTDNSSNEEYFDLERKATVGGSYASVATIGANQIIHYDGGLTANTGYTYRIRAATYAGLLSAWSNESAITTYPAADYTRGTYPVDILINDQHRTSDFEANEISVEHAASRHVSSANLKLKNGVPAIQYNSGSVMPILGETLTGATSAATGVVERIEIDSGTFAGGDAAGTIYFSSVSGQTFTAEETVNGEVTGTNVLSVVADLQLVEGQTLEIRKQTGFLQLLSGDNFLKLDGGKIRFLGTDEIFFKGFIFDLEWSPRGVVLDYPITALDYSGELDRPEALYSVPSMPFTSGSTEPQRGEKIIGVTSSAEGYVTWYELDSGTWAGGDAAGTVYLERVEGTFNASEVIDGTDDDNGNRDVTDMFSTNGATTYADDDDKTLIQTALGVTNSDIGVTTHVKTIQGSGLSSMSFDKATGREVLDALADRVGAQWWIDPEKELHYIEEGYDTTIILTDDLDRLQADLNQTIGGMIGEMGMGTTELGGGDASSTLGLTPVPYLNLRGKRPIPQATKVLVVGADVEDDYTATGTQFEIAGTTRDLVKKLEDHSLQDITTAQLRGELFLSEQYQRRTYRLSIHEPGLWAGKRIRLVNYQANLDTTARVQQQTTRFQRGGYVTIDLVLGEFEEGAADVMVKIINSVGGIF